MSWPPMLCPPSSCWWRRSHGTRWARWTRRPCSGSSTPRDLGTTARPRALPGSDAGHETHTLPPTAADFPAQGPQTLPCVGDTPPAGLSPRQVLEGSWRKTLSCAVCPHLHTCPEPRAAQHSRSTSAPKGGASCLAPTQSLPGPPRPLLPQTPRLGGLRTPSPQESVGVCGCPRVCSEAT